MPNAAPLSSLSTPINHKQIPIITASFTLEMPSVNSSMITTQILSPDAHAPVQNERRRSISPPLPPQMSPDNGRPLHHLTQITAQHIESTKQSKSSTRSPVENVPPQQTRKYVEILIKKKY